MKGYVVSVPAKLGGLGDHGRPTLLPSKVVCGTRFEDFNWSIKFWYDTLHQIKVVLAVVCSIANPKTTFGYLLFSELSSGRYPENYFKTFLTTTILEIIYIICKLGKISDWYVLLISSRYWCICSCCNLIMIDFLPKISYNNIEIPDSNEELKNPYMNRIDRKT